jgi:hypothetical protein
VRFPTHALSSFGAGVNARAFSRDGKVDDSNFDNAYSLEEQKLIASVPVTPAILIRAARSGTGALASFGYDVINPCISGLLDVSDQEKAIIASFSRLIALVRTCYELCEPHQFQSLAAGARSIFELSIDTALLSDPTLGGGRADRYHGHTRVTRYGAAKKLMAWYANHPDVPVPGEELDPQRELLAKPGIDVEIETLSLTLFSVPANEAARKHWTMLDMGRRAALISPEWESIYRQWVPNFNWYVHAGGAGVGGISEDGFAIMGLISREVIRHVVPGAYRKASTALHLSEVIDNFEDRLTYVSKYVELLAVAEARLQTAGHPGEHHGLL